jgi:hypothetical protein
MSVDARPTTDNVLDAEDLAIFALNFDNVSAPKLAKSEQPSGVEHAWIEVQDQVQSGQEVEVPVHIRGAGALRVVSVALTWNAEVVAPVGLRLGDFLATQGGIVLSPGPGAIDAALLGAREVGIQGEGTLGTVVFRALATGSAGIDFASVFGRDGVNAPVSIETARTMPAAEQTIATGLLPQTPNPFRKDSSVLLGLATPNPVDLSIYSVDGRRVRTLRRERMQPGVYRIPWDGRDNLGRSVASGIFYVRLAIENASFTKTIVYFK